MHSKIKLAMLTVLLALLLFALFPGYVSGQQAVTDFYLCSIDGIILPSVVSYIEKSVSQAEQDGRALIIQMDTPGGLETSMRDIIGVMLSASIPVVVYVAPQGARAASAGVFITYASDIAVMHPSTHIGAAHPVALGSEGVDSDSMEKIVNDSVAYIKSLAEARERNAEWAEKAVLESDSITAKEALELGVIDLTAENLDELLADIDQKTIEKHGEEILILSKDARVDTLEPSFINRFLQIISNPNIAYILFILGLMGIIYEFAQPGLGISGALGALFLILALYAFSVLPINYAGLGLIVLAIALFVLDFAMGMEGILSVCGIASLVIGSFLLIDSPAPYLKIARPLIIGASAVIAGFLIIVIRAVFLVHRKKPSLGSSSLIGREAVTVSVLNPEGQVKIDGEIWRAVSADDKKIRKNKRVAIQKTDGLTLYVKEINKRGG
ncbi:MAG: NfeD family protein [Actinomycetota bacterium]